MIKRLGIPVLGDGYAFCNWLTVIADRRFVMGIHKSFGWLSGSILDGIEYRFAYWLFRYAAQWLKYL